jgi:hypothetical protein
VQAPDDRRFVRIILLPATFNTDVFNTSVVHALVVDSDNGIPTPVQDSAVSSSTLDTTTGALVVDASANAPTDAAAASGPTGGGGKSFPVGGIIGIAVGGACIVALGVGLSIWGAKRLRNKSTDADRSGPQSRFLSRSASSSAEKASSGPEHVKHQDVELRPMPDATASGVGTDAPPRRRSRSGVAPI